jgi:hypothetical protein
VGGIWEARPVDQNDANDVQRKAQRYDLIEAALLDGDIFSALEQLNGKMSSKSVTRLVDNFLPSLLALSRDLYRRATRPVFGNWLGTVYSEADAMGAKGSWTRPQAWQRMYFSRTSNARPQSDTASSIAR